MPVCFYCAVFTKGKACVTTRRQERKMHRDKNEDDLWWKGKNFCRFLFSPSSKEFDPFHRSFLLFSRLKIRNASCHIPSVCFPFASECLSFFLSSSLLLLSLIWLRFIENRWQMLCMHTYVWYDIIKL